MSKIYIICILLLMGCKRDAQKTKIASKKEDKIQIINSDNKISLTENCYDYLTELVRSSNFSFQGITEEEINLLIDEDDGTLINAKVYFDTEGTGMLGWIQYNIKTKELLNTSANLEEPVKLKYDLKWSNKIDTCLGISPSKKVSNIDLTLKEIYSQANLINLPIKYSFQFISDEKYFIDMPKDLYFILSKENRTSFKIAKLPELNGIKPILLIGYDETGQSEMSLVTLNEKYKIIDKIVLYYSTDTDLGNLSTIYEITKEYKIFVKKVELIGEAEKIKEKGLQIKKYYIDDIGNIKLL